jgi:predicted nucleic acid-binding Zn finger protein
VIACYGERGRRALEAVEAGSVKRYLDFVVVVGTRDEYIVEEGLCTCEQSLVRNGFCWHQLAARIALLSGLCEEYDYWYHAALD